MLLWLVWMKLAPCLMKLREMFSLVLPIAKCSYEDFKAVFHHLLTHESIDQYSPHTLITVSFCGSSSSESTIAKIKQIICDTSDL